MIFSTQGRMRRVLGSAAVALALAACGGGTSQYEPFVAERLFAFGDEWSALTPDGRRFAVNGFSTTTPTQLDCQAFPIWTQSVAGYYGFVFAECNPANVAEPRAVMRAAAGAKVADVAAQIDAQISAGGFRDKDIATVLAGANDVLELYAQFPQRGEGELASEARARGRALALQVNRLVDLGSKVILSTMPDLGLTPFAATERTNNTDTDRAALLSRLTAAFNEQLGVNIVLDGRFIGLVQADLRLQAMVRSPAFFGLANVASAACRTEPDAALPNCTTSTLVIDANAGTWLWADATRGGSALQSQIALLALDRARRNPF